MLKLNNNKPDWGFDSIPESDRDGKTETAAMLGAPLPTETPIPTIAIEDDYLITIYEV